LAANLSERHHAQPVHTPPEMQMIRDLFPNEVDLWTIAAADGEILAGAWIFKMEKCAWHTQYIASTEGGRDCQAVDLLLETILDQAEQAGTQTFSFGACTEQQGRIINSGLYNFKAGFGFGAVTHDMYLVEIA
jgi:lipid II:glycine glycyltransferase (peptidoglycan interpeptide bridge formation enzyme)